MKKKQGQGRATTFKVACALFETQISGSLFSQEELEKTRALPLNEREYDEYLLVAKEEGYHA